VLIALGVTALLVRPSNEPGTSAEGRAPSAEHATTTTSLAASTTVAVAAAASSGSVPSAAAAVHPCARVTKHGPPPPNEDEFYEPADRAATANRRVLAMGSYGTHTWRLSLRRDPVYPRTNLELDHTNKDGTGGGSGTDPSESPLFVSGSSIGRDAWAYVGKAGTDSACVVVTSDTGVALATDELYRDAGYRDGVFFVNIVRKEVGCRGVTIESFDTSGTRTDRHTTGPLPKGFCD
jgi:hypothetical protein